MSSLCLSIPWWYVIYTARTFTEHERSFLMVNACATIASMIYRHVETPFWCKVDKTMICALQINYHVTSSIPLTLALSCVCQHHLYYVYVISIMLLMLEGHWIIILTTVLIGGICFTREEKHVLYTWTWHITQGLIMLYPILFNNFRRKVTLL